MKQSKKVVFLIIFIISAISLVACGNNEKKSEAIDVPKNNEEKRNNVEKKDANEANDVGNEIENADLSGGVAEINASGILLNKSNDEGTNEEGESIVATNRDGDKIAVEFTEKTEFKKLLIKDKKDGRLEKGSKTDVAVDTGVLLYGSYVGSKFVATKVIVTINE